MTLQDLIDSLPEIQNGAKEKWGEDVWVDHASVPEHLRAGKVNSPFAVPVLIRRGWQHELSELVVPYTEPVIDWSPNHA